MLINRVMELEQKRLVKRQETIDLKQTIEDKLKVLHSESKELTNELHEEIVLIVEEEQSNIFFKPDVLKFVHGYAYDNGIGSSIIDAAMNKVFKNFDLKYADFVNGYYTVFEKNDKSGSIAIKIPSVYAPYGDDKRAIVSKEDADDLAKFYEDFKNAFLLAYPIEERMMEIKTPMNFSIPFYVNNGNEFMGIEFIGSSEEWVINSSFGNPWFYSSSSGDLSELIYSLLVYHNNETEYY